MFLKKKKNIGRFIEFAPPGHYYSPIPSMEDIEAIWERLNRKPPQLPGIDMNVEKQLEFLDIIGKLYDDMPFQVGKTEGLRYYFDNIWFVYCDGVVLHCMMRHFKSQRIIEIGSGFSSCCMLDTNQLFFDNSISLSFIEPNPGRLLENITDTDKEQAVIIDKKLQEVPLDTFRALEAGDILFIDSTHISKFGSDVNYILFDILPVLAEGVVIHFHDIFYPFDYPMSWYREGRAWNEAYILRAFLQYNKTFEILFFISYIHSFYREKVEAVMPISKNGTGGSLWLVKSGTG